MKLNRIELKFRKLALIKGGVFLLENNNAVKFVEECKKYNFDITGIETFRVVEKRIQPIQEKSVDFGDNLQGNHQRALDFLNRQANYGLWHEVVVDN